MGRRLARARIGRSRVTASLFGLALAAVQEATVFHGILGEAIEPEDDEEDRGEGKACSPQQQTEPDRTAADQRIELIGVEGGVNGLPPAAGVAAGAGGAWVAAPGETMAPGPRRPSWMRFCSSVSGASALISNSV